MCGMDGMDEIVEWDELMKLMECVGVVACMKGVE